MAMEIPSLLCSPINIINRRFSPIFNRKFLMAIFFSVPSVFIPMDDPNGLYQIPYKTMAILSIEKKTKTQETWGHWKNGTVARMEVS